MTPDENNFPLRAFLTRLMREGYRGDMVIELYRGGFSELEELRAAAAHIGALYAELKNGQDGEGEKHR